MIFYDMMYTLPSYNIVHNVKCKILTRYDKFVAFINPAYE